MVPKSKNARENQFDAIIEAAAARHGVPPEIIKGVVGVESSFNPRAKREEPQISDRSRGLMQLLERTARGLGFRGDFEQLYDPATNVELGAKLLAQNFRRWKSWDLALAYYNGGGRDLDDLQEPRDFAYIEKVRKRIASFLSAPAVATGGGGLVLIGAGLWWFLRRRRRGQ